MPTSSVPVGSGRFVIFVGPDGVGKTTVAEALIERHAGPAGYFHFLPPVSGRLARGPLLGSAPPPAKADGDHSRVLGWIRLLKNAVRCWVGYLRTIRPALNRSWLVVGDRWMYGYLVQPSALKFRGPDLLARTILRLLPRPHLIVNLSAPPHLIRERKQELTHAQIERELIAWSSLHLPNLRTLDATCQPHAIVEEILEALASGDRRG